MYIEQLEAKVKDYQKKVVEAKRTISRYEESLAKNKARLSIAKKVMKDYNSGKYTQHELADKYDMPRTSIQNIIKK